MPDRAAFYVDGFNLFHAIDDLNKPHLKWVNLAALANRVIPSRSEYLVRVVQCTAIRKPKDKNDAVGLERQKVHQDYVKALTITGVECLMGHFTNEIVKCRNNRCGHTWDKANEKQGDVNVAIELIDEAHMDMFDHAYLITNDTDQVATISLFIKRFISKGKKLTLVQPPRLQPILSPGQRHHRQPHSHFDQFNGTIGRRQLTEADIENSLFPHVTLLGNESVRRPLKYAPPQGFAVPFPAVQHISSYAPPADPADPAGS